MLIRYTILCSQTYGSETCCGASGLRLDQAITGFVCVPPLVVTPLESARWAAFSGLRRGGDGAERAADGGGLLDGGLEKMKSRSFYFTRSQIKRTVAEDFGVSLPSSMFVGMRVSRSPENS